MGDGFQVDLQALSQAADGISRTVGHVSRPMTAAPGDAVGHGRLAQILAEFADRWQLGVENLTEDGRAVAALLTEAAGAYGRTDAATRQNLDGVLRVPSGPDPAAR